jgi:PST family polysaccharide transporter
MTSTRDIVKSGVKVGVATVASLLGWLVAGKVLAVYVGASGVGLFGLVRQLLQNLTVVATFSGQNAIVQGIAQLEEGEEQTRYGVSVLLIQLLLASALAVPMVAAAGWLGPQLIPHPRGAALLGWLVVPLFATVVQTWILGILNGHRRLEGLVRAQLWAPAAVLALVLPMIVLIRQERPTGYAIMLAGPAAAVALGGLWEARRAGLLRSLAPLRIRGADARRFFAVSGVLLVSAVLASGTQYLESWAVARFRGLEAAGQFWTAWMLSMTYVTLILGSYGTYYLPHLTRLKEGDERRALIRRYLDLSLVAMPVLVTAVVLLKPLVIRLVFSDRLLPALPVMRWMLIGDLLKGVSWVLAFPMIAFGHLRWMLWSEAVFSVAMAGGAVAWLSLGGGIEGLGVLFALAYAGYLVAMAVYARTAHGFRFTAAELLHASAGAALVLSTSAVTWADDRVRPEAVLFALVSSIAFLALVAGRPAYAAVRRTLGLG